jgi:hypothetical protein
MTQHIFFRYLFLLTNIYEDLIDAVAHLLPVADQHLLARLHTKKNSCSVASMFFPFSFSEHIHRASTHKDCTQEPTLALAENDSQRTRLSRSIQNYTQQTNVQHAVCVGGGGGGGGYPTHTKKRRIFINPFLRYAFGGGRGGIFMKFLPRVCGGRGVCSGRRARMRSRRWAPCRDSSYQEMEQRQTGPES